MAVNMADKTYANVLNNVEEHSIDSVKQVFILETDLFGNVIPNKDQYLTHVEMNKAVYEVVMGSHLKGLQRVRGLWRMYLDNEDDREKLITTGLVIRAKQIQIYSNNPKVAQFQNPDHLKIRVKNIPCSAEDGQITRALEQLGCVVHSLFRERLRVDGMLTNCQTGDRIAICEPISEPLPRSLTIGKYRANIIHRNQNPESKKIICNKCYEEGHRLNECPNDWVCKTCHTPGHQQADCPVTFSDGEGEEDQSTVTDDELSDDTAEETQSLENVPTTTTGSSSMDTLNEEESTEDTPAFADNASTNTSTKPAHKKKASTQAPSVKKNLQ
ncbi:hypothetical protein FSP39_018372 [Pinctada imbricata]|uniref:CCHC-type domain-containing protein n=1 Tax=Pinctada imbricata TaxID=66713 RepID=A0AA88YP66_PINIB|nr:hypothetical protein FSP39_018372 [Pinctada imbricata]